MLLIRNNNEQWTSKSKQKIAEHLAEEYSPTRSIYYKRY